MNDKVPGLSSILLLFVALGIADYQLFTVSTLLGVIYLLCTPIVFLNLLYLYCRKCPHVKNGTCRHVLFGWVVKKLFKPLEPAQYKVKEVILALLPLVIYVVFPLYWLFQNRSLFIAFWILMLIAVMIVRTGVCTSCKNTHCKMCPNAPKQ